MRLAGIGVDIAEVRRFRTVLKEGKTRFLDNTFSKAEQAYCGKYRDPAPHLAGTFAAKEAVLKATGDFSVPLTKLEVRRDKNGKPELWRDGRRSKKIVLSITHTSSLACAVALTTS
jgi:holo-[acyl-carrier protein] synthase